MDNLQRLLDEKWPMKEYISDSDHDTMAMFRKIFTEGYNAGYAELQESYERQAKQYLNSLKPIDDTKNY